jgi:hypothetical protein
MTRIRTVAFLISVSVLCSAYIQAQCIQYPADCPSDRQLPDSAGRLANPLVPEEVSMEIRLHDFFTDGMRTLAQKNRWEVYQYDESDGSGHLNADGSGPLDYSLRPPHDYEISFIFIVNKDSLRAWQDQTKDWYSKFTEEVEKMKSSPGVTDLTRLQADKKNSDIHFRNACLIRVKIDINPESAIATSIHEDMHLTGQLKVSDAVVAFQIHNDKTDERAIFDLDQFKRCTDLAFLLFGSWDPKPDKDQRFHPAYSADRKNTDLVTPKTIRSDRVRTIVIHVEGAPYYINQFLQSLDTEKLNRLK